jgi:hydrogenase/urease accessory protein HupE
MSRALRRLAGGLIGLVSVMTIGSVSAHPAAQGRMNFDLAAETLTVTVTVSAEEVFVGTTLGKLAREPQTLTETWQAYGDYLLLHLRVAADGKFLTGRLTNVVAPENAPPTPVAMSVERAIYTFEFAICPPRDEEVKIDVEQDALSEILFAPGNPWTASYVVSARRDGRVVQEGLLLDSRRPLALQFPVPASTAPAAALSQWRIWRDYFQHGVWHILTGYDHLLFVTALALAAISWWDLVKVISAFTLAHTITLILAVLNIIRLPAHIVEPMISASIVFVAVQNVFFPEKSRGWSRLGAAFGFGLFHGLGFAGGLLDAMAELPGTALVSALSAFSLGVEVGHQCVVLPVFFVLMLVTKKYGGLRRGAILRFGSVLIAAAGAFYLAEALRG